MNQNNQTEITMKALRFHEYGEPLDVLRWEQSGMPTPMPGHIRVKVRACGLNPADWAMCKGFMESGFPRGIGFDVSGVVAALGEGATGVAVGDAVFGSADLVNYDSCGAAEYAVLDHWAKKPEGLGFTEAASLPMAVMTACSHLDVFGSLKGKTLMVHGAGAVVGYAAVQIAMMRGAHVIATAGETYAESLRAMGAMVTPYGAGMVERVKELAGGPVDFVLETAAASSSLPALIEIAGGRAQNVLTISAHAEAQALGVGSTFSVDLNYRYDVLDEYAGYAAEGTFSIPIAKTFAPEDWREAVRISQSGHAHGKLVLLYAADR